MARTLKKYSLELKQQAVQEYLAGKGSLRNICKKHGIKDKKQAAKMRQSMSRAGRCIDNGPMESFWGMLKSEMYYLQRFTDRDSLIPATENHIYFYNNARFQKRLHCMTPMEFHYAYAA